jgi:hypothetical protein
MAEMKGIKVCGECGNYDWKRHKCKIGCNDDSNAQAPFYGDCPLPDVVPKSEVERLNKELDELAEEHGDLIIEKDQLFDIAEKQKLEIWRLQGEVERLKKESEKLTINMNAYGLAAIRLAEENREIAKEIFTAIEFEIHNLDFDREETRAIAIEGVIANLKREYTEGESNGSKQ